MLRVHSIETLGANEGPGIRMVLFLQGCKLRCVYCHNPDTHEIKAGTEYSTEDILKLVLRYKPYFKTTGGLTVSGGEPMLQAKELIPLFKEIKNHGLTNVIDTCGFIFNDDVKELLKYTDLVLLDVKEIDEESHIRLTKVSNKKTLEMAKYLEDNSISTWIRFVLMPEYTDNFEHIELLGQHFKDYKCIDRIEILPYHTLGVHKYDNLNIEYPARHIEAPSRELIEKVKDILQKYFKKVLVR